jgi:hypothetical protein
LGELLEPTVGDFAEEPDPAEAAAPRPDDGLDWGLEGMDGLPATPAEPVEPVEPVDLSDILGGTEEAPSSQDQASDGGEYDVVSAPAAAGAGEGDVEFELPEATGDQMAEVPGTPEFAEQEPAGFEFEDREIPEDAFDGDLLPDAGETAEPPAGPALELEEAAEQEAALDMASLREVDSVDIGLDDLGGGPEQEPSAPIHEPAFPAPEGQAPPITPEPQEDLAVAESADEEWQVSIDDAPPAPAWDEVTMEAVTDLPEQPGAVEEMRTETESETSEAVAPGWSDLDSAFSPGEEPAKPASDESITEPRDDLTAGLAATAGRAVREALERSLSAEQLAPVIAAAVERVAWEVVPQLAERLIRETIEKLQQDPPAA